MAAHASMLILSVLVAVGGLVPSRSSSLDVKPSQVARAVTLGTAREQAVAAVEADPECLLMENVERASQVIDLDGGDVGVIVACGSGMVETWSRLYVSDDGGPPTRAHPIQFDVRGDGRWRDDDDTSDLTWDAPTQSFTGVSRQQATGCVNGARWHWDGSEVRLVEQWIIDCHDLTPEGDLPDPVTVWPTVPPTPVPVADNTD